VIQKTLLRRALVMSGLLHIVGALLAWVIVPAPAPATELVDIEVAPVPPRPEALPPEVARPPAEEPESGNDERNAKDEPATTPPGPSDEGIAEAMIDAGVDAPVDARPDAPVDARPDARPDAPPDAAIDAAIDAASDADADDAPADAGVDDAPDAGVDDAPDAGVDDAPDDAADDPDALVIASAGDAASDDAGADAVRDSGDETVQAAADARVPDDAAQVAANEGSGAGSGSGPGSGSGSGSGSGAGSGSNTSAPAGAVALDTRALAAALAAAKGAGSGSGSGVAGTVDTPAVDGAPTTAGTAANLLGYFPPGHVVTALIRFDRLRGTEWAAQADRLLRPMPDYHLMFGTRDANLADKLETLVISSPRPRDASATTLVARTSLARPALRDFLAARTPVRWSAAQGGLLGKRTGPVFPGDQRVFLSPFKGWFLLAQPDDLGTLTATAKGNLDAVEATGKLPPWLAGIRAIEAETGEPRGPALVVTVGLGGNRVSMPAAMFALGVVSVPTPQRVSAAMELVPQGWLVRGNMHFASEADAIELINSVQRVQLRIAGSRTFQLVLGKPVANVLANLAFARNGARVSYATSISIADARALLAAAALQLDQYYGRPP
jgi:hypothetical protein